MKAVIVGCGRVGATLADALDAAGHEVVIIDTQTRAFDRLPSTFRGSAIRGDGTDEDVLRRAGAEGADVFLALTEGDNRNTMASQLAADVLGVRKVIAKINDPVRADAYASLGIATLCRTNLMADAVYASLRLPTRHLPGIQEPTGTHPGGDHHAEVEAPGSATRAPSGPAAVPSAGSPAAPSPARSSSTDREG
jgi:trk system potassium uptake protein TrkA